MFQRKNVLTSMVLVLMLACEFVAIPLETPVPPSPTPQSVVTLPPETPTLEIAATQEAPVVQIGFFESLYLRYDPGEWEARDETQGQQTNQKGEPVQSLHHRAIPGCILHDNLGRGVPPTWKRQDTERMIGSLEFRVEAWTDTEVQRPVLTVYQYPPGESGLGKRIELVIGEQPEECIQSAEQVLSLSADLISEPP